MHIFYPYMKLRLTSAQEHPAIHSNFAEHRSPGPKTFVPSQTSLQRFFYNFSVVIRRYPNHQGLNNPYKPRQKKHYISFREDYI